MYLALPVVLDGYETWCFLLNEERRLSEVDSGLLREVFGPEREVRCCVLCNIRGKT
jgi:hypothetical protein